jgi:hypothetical protein
LRTRGFNVNKVRQILMNVGIVVAVVSIVVMAFGTIRLRQTVAGDSHGNVARRVDFAY